MLLAILNLSGQTDRRAVPPLRERLFFGGDVGLQFGTITNIHVSPTIGVWLTPRLSIAGGPTYEYYKDPYGSTDIWGPRAYSQFMIIKDINNIIPIGMGMGIGTHIEYEGLSLEKSFFVGDNEPGRIYVSSFLAGFVVNQSLGSRSFMSITVLWALSENEYQIYSNPEIRIGFMF
jgi:hypothetical protein